MNIDLNNFEPVWQRHYQRHLEKIGEIEISKPRYGLIRLIVSDAIEQQAGLFTAADIANRIRLNRHYVRNDQVSQALRAIRKRGIISEHGGRGPHGYIYRRIEK